MDIVYHIYTPRNRHSADHPATAKVGGGAKVRASGYGVFAEAPRGGAFGRRQLTKPQLLLVRLGKEDCQVGGEAVIATCLRAVVFPQRPSRLRHLEIVAANLSGNLCATTLALQDK